MRYFEGVKDEHRKNSGDIRLPVRATKNSACYDFFSPVEITINPNENIMIATDVKVKMNEDEALMLYVRSSMGKHPIVISNGTGIIDSDYYSNPDNDGNIGFRLFNLGNTPYEIHVGDRIGQGMFIKYLVTDDDKATAQRMGGFGSSGK